MDGWKLVFCRLERLAVDVRADRPHDADIDGGESFEIALWVTGWDACRVLSGVQEITLPARQCLARFAITIKLEVIRVLLVPLDRALRGVDAERQPVLLAGGYLADCEHAPPPLFQRSSAFTSSLSLRAGR